MLDEISRRILKTIYGFGIEGTKLSSGNQIPPHRSSSGLHIIFSDISKTTFYRKLNNLKKEGYIIIEKKKRLSRSYEIVNGRKITIPAKHSRSREIQLTEKGKKIVSESLIEGFPEKIDILINGKIERILFIDAIDYLKMSLGVEIRTAVFHLLNQIENDKSPVDVDLIRQEFLEKK